MFGMFGKKSGTISMKEAQAELEQNKGIILIDVRTGDEYSQGHIKGSINIPLDTLPSAIGQKVPDKNAKIFVHCLSGARSNQASRWMCDNGYTDVTNIGGISSWPGPIIKG
ncbi:MAG: rhodanese-like domain-containing protein [Clostridiales bacterium]|nr:rhodanese-like domain-containing protein [Clostridiales bacterium]